MNHMSITIEQVIELAASKGRIVKPCHDPEWAQLDCGEAPNDGRGCVMTSDGAFLLVEEGRYWQAGPMQDVWDGLKALK
jgi:hypothetical protein